MNNPFVRTLTAAALLVLAGAANAVDAERGAQLHAQNCVTCHRSIMGGDGSALYTRNDRKITTLAGLETQVRRCENNLGLTWFDDQVADVVEYLNANYYHFGEDSEQQPQDQQKEQSQPQE
jgi:mono/diheme cytochrome c family protein